MELINLSEQESILNHFIREIRDVNLQNDSMRFRRNLERIGEVFAYEISKRMHFYTEDITTPLGISKEKLISEKLVLATILRAGLPFHQGFLNYFDQSENAFISAYRKHGKKDEFKVIIEYISCPEIHNKTIILCDPMLASGISMVLALEAILAKGNPNHVHLVSVIASKDGVNYLRQNAPLKEFTLWTAAIDEEMTHQSYIVPGLGDAGDLAFGKKIK